VKYVGLIILFLLALSYLLFSGEKEYRMGSSIKANSYIEGLRIVHKKNGTDSWVISAKKADFTRDETVAKMSTVTVDAKKEGIILNADSGTYNLTTREILLEDNIKIRIKDSVISAKSLSWDPSREMLTSPDRVRMDGKNFRIEGDGLVATQDQKLKLTRNVQATFF
jgi:LPS export ABC transporter protein LptC